MEKRIPEAAGIGDATLIITAEDYGYAPTYNDGILEATAAGGVDSVSAMVMRADCRPAPLLHTGVEVGLHLELPGVSAWGTRWVGPRQREAAVEALAEQLQRFEELFGGPPAYLDGHRHCHAAAGLASAIARIARERRLPVRSIDQRHRRLLRRLGIATPDRLVGRLREHEPALPGALKRFIEGDARLPAGVTEWMTHPGHPEPATGSGYNAGRKEDLGLLLSLSLDPALAAARRTHLAALG